MCPHGGYYHLMRQSKDPKYLRLRMVQLAKEHGTKPAARLFGCAPNTVRKWLRRYDGTLASLECHWRAPHHRPNKLSPEAEKEIIAAKRRLRPWGAARLKRDMNLPYSEKAIRRVCKEHGLTRKWRRKKYQTKQCLREVKRRWRAWQQIDVDVKHLDDLPEYWLQAQQHGLPRYQFTARDVTTGALFLAFSDELALVYADLFVKRILNHLKHHSVELRKVTIQTDNGSEFIGSWQAAEKSAFTQTIERFKATHHTIPPGAHRFQADVETVHALMETEFYRERFRARQDFLAKAATYQLFFNHVRTNSGKEHQCPYDLLKQKRLKATRRQLYLPPVFLEDRLQQQLHPQHGVHDVRTYPCFQVWVGRKSKRISPGGV
jgi:transposase